MLELEGPRSRGNYEFWLYTRSCSNVCRRIMYIVMDGKRETSVVLDYVMPNVPRRLDRVSPGPSAYWTNLTYYRKSAPIRKLRSLMWFPTVACPSALNAAILSLSSTMSCTAATRPRSLLPQLLHLRDQRPLYRPRQQSHEVMDWPEQLLEGWETYG